MLCMIHLLWKKLSLFISYFLSTHSIFNLFFDTQEYCSKVLYFLSVFFSLLGTLGHIWRSNKTVLLYPWWSYSGCKEIINITLFCCCCFFFVWGSSYVRFLDVNMLIKYTVSFLVDYIKNIVKISFLFLSIGSIVDSFYEWRKSCMKTIIRPCLELWYKLSRKLAIDTDASLKLDILS